MGRKKAPSDGEQLLIPGTEPIKNRRVHPKAVRYAELRDARMAANKEEKAAHDTLLQTMLEEGLENYTYDGIEVAIDSSQKCKVKVAGRSGDEGGEEE